MNVARSNLLTSASASRSHFPNYNNNVFIDRSSLTSQSQCFNALWYIVYNASTLYYMNN